ncbi:MAG: ArsR/SmtB family transcription factor [Bacillota bacterium]
MPSLKKADDVCEVFCSDVQKVELLKGKLVDTAGLSMVFKALADETRLKIVYALSMEELCVCDTANLVGVTVQAASHHLRLLRNLGLAKYRKEGKLVYYSLDDEHVIRMIREAAAHHKEGK